MGWVDEHTRVTLYLRLATLKGIEATMVVKGKSRSAIIEEAIRQYLEKIKGGD